MASRPEECGGYHCDAVWAAVGVAPRGYDSGVQELVAELIPQPKEMAYVVVVDRGRQFDLQCEHSGVVADKNKVHLTLTAFCTKVTHFGFRRLCIDTKAETNQ